MEKILILGITASGKARLSFDLACKLETDIISIDSMKVYRRMNIGTASPSAEARKKVNYHLIDIVEPWEAFSVDKFLEMVKTAIDEITAKGQPIIASGGTAMYIKALLYGLFEGPGNDEKIRAKLKDRIVRDGLAKMHDNLKQIDPAAAERIHPNDEKRITRAMEVYEITGKPISSLQKQFEAEKPKDNWKIIGLRREKEIESRRINARVKRMVADGLVDEVKALLAEDKPLSQQAGYAIGYAEIINHLNGKYDLDTAIEQIKINTRKMAKSQRTWFKTFKGVNWLDIEEDETPENIFDRTKKLLGI